MREQPKTPLYARCKDNGNRFIKMIFANFIKPKWQHRKPHIRKQALKALDLNDADGMAVLVRMACADEETDIRRLAVKHLIDLDLLQQIAGQDAEEKVCQAAHQRFLQLLVGTQHDALNRIIQPALAERLAKIAVISEAKTLEFIVCHGAETELRLAALVRIEREAFCGDVAIQDPDQGIRLAALDRITQKSTLQRVLKHARGKDKRVSAQIKTRLAALSAQQERPLRLQKRAKQFCAEIETLTATTDWPRAHVRFSAIGAQWISLTDEWHSSQDGPWDTGLSERFSLVSDLFLQGYNEYLEKEAEQRAIEAQRDPIRTNMRALCEGLEGLAAEMQQCQAPQPDDGERLNKALSDIRGTWRMSEQLSPAEQRSFQARYDQACDTVEQFVQDISRYHHAVNDMQVLTANGAKLLADQRPIDAARIKRLEQQWQDLQRPVHFTIAASDQRHCQDLLASLHARCTAEVQRQKQDLEVFKGLVGDLETALAQGKSQHAMKLQHRAQKLLNRMPEKNVGILHHNGYQHRLTHAAKRVQELLAWKRWASTPLKERLVADMEELAGEVADANTHNPDFNALARDIQNARLEWKRLGESEPDSAQELWQRFNAACNQVYSLCQDYFDRQTQERDENLEKKQVICHELEQFIAGADWDNIDWRRAERIVRVAHSEWNSIGPVNRKDQAVIDGRFHKVMHTLRTNIGAERNRNQARKEELVQRIGNLAESLQTESLQTGSLQAGSLQAGSLEDAQGDSPELHSAIEQVKEFQAQWKAIGVANGERKLWKGFRGYCDQIFARREQHFKGRDQERQANLQAKLAICATVEGLALTAPAHPFEPDDPDHPDTLKQAHGQYRQAKREWAQIGPVPGDAVKELNRRFGQACRQFEQRDRLRMADAQLAQVELLVTKAHLCLQLESVVEEMLTGVLDHKAGLERLESTQRVWQETASLEDDVEMPVHRRFQNAVDALMNLVNGRGETTPEQYRTKQRAHLTACELVCLRMELLTDIESPVEARQARLEYQVSLLADKMKQAGVLNQEEQRAADTREAILMVRNWSATGPVPADQAALLERRFGAAREAFFNKKV